MRGFKSDAQRRAAFVRMSKGKAPRVRSFKPSKTAVEMAEEVDMPASLQIALTGGKLPPKYKSIGGKRYLRNDGHSKPTAEKIAEVLEKGFGYDTKILKIGRFHWIYTRRK